MPTNVLISEIETFHNNQEIFSDILTYFSSKIKYLSYKLNYPETGILDVINCETKDDEYSDIIFNDLISSLNSRQKEIIFYKFYMQLSDIEIAKLFKISRQAVNKAQRAALKILKVKLLA